MQARRQAWIKGVQIAFAGILVSGLSAQVSEYAPHVGIPEDWTHHHIRFSSAILRQHPEIASREPRAGLLEPSPLGRLPTESLFSTLPVCT